MTLRTALHGAGARELCRFHGHYGGYHGHAMGFGHTAYAHAAYAHAGGGIGHMIVLWIMHAMGSFFVWHILGSLTHHLGLVGTIAFTLFCVGVTYLVWKLVRGLVRA